MPPAGESITTDGTVAYIQYRPGLIMASIPIGPNDFVADFLTSAHTESLKLSEAINTVINACLDILAPSANNKNTAKVVLA